MKKTLRTPKILLFVIGISFLFFSGKQTVSADYTGFLAQLKSMNMPVQTLLSQKSITRYEVARLLNAVECVDCITPSSSTVSLYSSQFWHDFLLKPDKDFADISYQSGFYNKSNYYYCVAYAGDNNYMRGYPVQTSPICAGLFCGVRGTTNAEFLQIIINLLAKYIYTTTYIDWSLVKTWMDGLNDSSYAYKTLSQDDMTIILANAKTCKDQYCALTKPEELKTYLKFCEYNLQACGMVPMGNIKQGSWPVAELNLVTKQQIMSASDAVVYNTQALVEGKQVIDMLGNLFDIVGCKANSDYDCDGIQNPQDNCPRDYNASQRDTDGDSIGDVCDEDIDGDKIKNPVGIVDDLGHVVVRLWSGNADPCLFVSGVNCSQSMLGLSVSVQKIYPDLPARVDFSALVKGDASSLMWDFGDGSSGEGSKPSHTYQQAGRYIVQVHAKGETNDAFATTTVVIGQSLHEKFALQILLDSPGSTQIPTQVSMGASFVGDADPLIRKIDQATGTTKPDHFSQLFSLPGEHTVQVKATKNGSLVAGSVFTIGVGSGARGALLKTSTLTPEVNQQITLSTIGYHLTNADINAVLRDFGDGKSLQTSTLDTTHTYNQAGKHTIKQTIYRKDGVQMVNVITIFVMDASLFRSYALQLSPSTLWAKEGDEITLYNSIEGDYPGSPFVILERYGDQFTKLLPNPTKQKIPFQETHTYNQAGLVFPQTTIGITQCTQLQSQATIAFEGVDQCLALQKAGKLKAAMCDLDKDGVPDICDEDIDGDGKKNLIGIITNDLPGCVFIPKETTQAGLKGNIDLDMLAKHFGVCSLDNSALVANPDQLDLNKDGIGDIGLGFASGVSVNVSGLPISTLLGNDADQDGIEDTKDLCPTLPETYNTIDDLDGCPEIGADLACSSQQIYPTCGNSIVDPGETCLTCPQDLKACLLTNICLSCPCPYADKAGLVPGDSVQAVLRNPIKSIPYTYSLPRDIQ